MNLLGHAYKTKTLQSAAAATGDGETLDLLDGTFGAMEQFTAQVKGINGDTITWEGSCDGGTTWAAVRMTPLATGTAATTATADGLYSANLRGVHKVRARISTYSAGAITVIGTGA